MAKPLVSDELWELIAPLLPVHEPSPKGGRPRVDDRLCLTGILFVLKTGIPWEDLPQEMNCGCGMTCWRRLAEWHEAGVWEALHAACLEFDHPVSGDRMSFTAPLPPDLSRLFDRVAADSGAG